MSVRVSSLTPVEAEYYEVVPDVKETIDSVGQMVMDLHDEDVELQIVLAMNDEDDPTSYTLAFSGSTLSLDIYPDRIDVTDFDLLCKGKDEVLETFDRDNINGATLWLINKLEEPR